jgi:hypothetical protein
MGNHSQLDAKASEERANRAIYGKGAVMENAPATAERTAKLPPTEDYTEFLPQERENWIAFCALCETVLVKAEAQAAREAAATG